MVSVLVHSWETNPDHLYSALLHPGVSGPEYYYTLGIYRKEQGTVRAETKHIVMTKLGL